MNSEDVSAYAYEKEVLIQDGAEYLVKRNDEIVEIIMMDDGKVGHIVVTYVVLEKMENKFDRMHACTQYCRFLFN